MKLNFLLKSIPFLSTLLLIIVLNISNQKINTKLRILIWSTPSLSLGNYLAISTGAGFILSYILTTNLASIVKLKSKNSLQFKPKTISEDKKEDIFKNFKNTKEKILIERNINDPSPTMNAQFRVIGKTELYNKDYVNDNIQYNNSYNYEESYNDQNENNETINHEKEVSPDWNDDSFTRW